jgi:hypothetical protein
VVDNTGLLLTSPSGVQLTYEGVTDPAGSINTTSSDKTNFWSAILPMFGVSLPVDTDLLGNKMPGAANRLCQSRIGPRRRLIRRLWFISPAGMSRGPRECFLLSPDLGLRLARHRSLCVAPGKRSARARRFPAIWRAACSEGSFASRPVPVAVIPNRGALYGKTMSPCSSAAALATNETYHLSVN